MPGYTNRDPSGAMVAVGFQGDPRHHLEVVHGHGILDPQEFVLPQRLIQPNGRRQVEGAMTVNAQVHIHTDTPEAVFELVERFRTQRKHCDQ